MENFILWFFDSFSIILSELSFHTVNTIDMIFNNFFEGNNSLSGTPFNLTLFSDTPILSTNVWDGLLLTFSILYTVIFVVIVYKIIKKVFVKITRWNKW